jgi:hypothetical protein
MPANPQGRPRRVETFWNDAELQKVLGDLAPKAEAPEPQLDKAAQLQKKWKTKRGQIWEIGRQRSPPKELVMRWS